jgi:hypothetical protein
VDDFFWEALDQPPEGTAYSSLSGIAIYSYDNPKLAPRDAADMVE